MLLTFPAIMVFLLGAAIGSFLNVVILRLPSEGESIVFPGSHCPKCSNKLKWFDNIPILSFIILGGKCRKCKESISFQYPLVELIMALLGLGLFVKFMISIPFLIYFVFFAALLSITFIDLKHYIIPDRISLPGIGAGFIFSFFNPYLHWSESILGIVIGGGVLYLIAVIYSKLRHIEGMGGGDIKLLGMIGAFLGWQSLPFVIFASSLGGTLAGTILYIATRLSRKKSGSFGQTRIPFGPFLALASMIFVFFNETLIHFMAVIFS